MAICHAVSCIRSTGTVSTSALHPLYTVLVRPLLRKPACNRSPDRHTRSLRNPSIKSFHTTIVRSLKVARAPEGRPQAWDNEIPATWVQIIDPETHRPGEPRRLQYILQSLNKDYRVVCQQTIPSPVPADWMPMCKIISKVQAFEDQKRILQKAKDSKKISANKPRTIEINWAIEKHDLEVRLGRLKDLLVDGKRVEVLLARKRKSRIASVDECKAVMGQLQEVLDSVNVRHVVPSHGEVGGLIKMTVEKKEAQS